MPGSNSRQSVKTAFLWDGIGSRLQENVTLVFEQGVITDITESSVEDTVDLGNTVIIPPLANVHAHLEFSHLKQPLTPALPFTNWIGKTMADRRANPDVQRSIESGIAESAQAGVALLGEIVTDSSVTYKIKNGTPSLVLFRELIGLTPEAVKEQQEIVAEFLEQDHGHHSPGCFHSLGLSPHAPYTVRPELLNLSIESARRFHLPITIHLAETRAELELLRSGTGEIVGMLQKLGLWDPQMIESGIKPLDYLRHLSRAPQTIVAHGNYLDDEEIDFLANEPQMSVAYCPRTHAFFQHDKHRWREMHKAGVNVALGTDGRGSNPDLDLWKEAQFLGRNATSSEAKQILQMATVNGWRACGKPVRIEVGQRACWTMIRHRGAPAKRFTDWSDIIGQQTYAESVNHAGPRLLSNL